MTTAAAAGGGIPGDSVDDGGTNDVVNDFRGDGPGFYSRYALLLLTLRGIVLAME